MYTLNWQPPYDWQWMFGFLGARAVTGIETVTHDYYERSFACEGHQGIFRATPDIATHTLTVTLSPGLIPVAQTCLERIERLFISPATRSISRIRWAISVLPGQACVCRGRWTRTSRAYGRSSGSW